MTEYVNLCEKLNIFQSILSLVAYSRKDALIYKWYKTNYPASIIQSVLLAKPTVEPWLTLHLYF